jgi:hypothetical protein
MVSVRTAQSERPAVELFGIRTAVPAWTNTDFSHHCLPHLSFGIVVLIGVKRTLYIENKLEAAYRIVACPTCS